MSEISLAIPQGVIDGLPEDSQATKQDVHRAVSGIESRLNAEIEDAATTAEAASVVVDAIEFLEDRMERYDAFVPELRAWGQSPIYAITWRNLYAELIAQLYDHEWLAEELDRERNYRIVEDGIRFGG
ncbi:hypothetical protein [Halopenitus persicus]|uniref:hypothetical protein n=1 Tax=Halopenitus persicus TaxID=1048396 RepID=UPI000BBB0968|nr:hypothetical protein [Halopenitus persicus]